MLSVLWVLLLAIVTELIEGVGIARCADCGGPSILPGSATMLVAAASALQAMLLADQAYHVRYWALTARDAGTNRLVEVDQAAAALQRVPPQTVRLVRILVVRSAPELPFAVIGIFRINVFVTSSIYRSEAFRSHECPSSFVVIYANACNLWVLLVNTDARKMYASYVDLVARSSAPRTDALRIEAYASLPSIILICP
jgi:hypothetical protein